MTKLSILFCLLAALVCSINAADEEPVKKAQDKVLVIKEHILHTADVDKKAFEKIHLEKDSSKPMAELQPAAAVETKPDEKIPVQPGSLQPILPMLNGMSPFLKSIFDSVASSDNANNDNEQQQQQQQQQLLVDPVPVADSEQQPPKRHGIMTIVFMKAIRNPVGAGMEDHQSPDLADQDQQQQQQQPQGGIMHIQLRPNIGLMLNQILPRRVSQMLGIDASADDDMSMMKPMQLIGADDLDRVANQHLLGGKDDIADHFRAFNDDISSFGDDTKLQPDEISSFQIGGQEPSFLLRPAHDENQKQPKKCMMMSFMRLKASAYYRTIVHLLFFSGIILLILFMIILAIRVYKRSKALRYYNHNINIATIDDQAYPTKRGANSYLFRSGSIRSSYEQKQALANDLKASPLMYQVSPPAYEQIISTSINNNTNDDAKSVTSLPDYQESVSKKNPESNA